MIKYIIVHMEASLEGKLITTVKEGNYKKNKIE
jgi:hypothetical protein